MAKKMKKQSKKAANNLPENALPQNILPVGERVEENKNIYISQDAYKEIHRFTKNKTTNESGGMLVGTIIEEFGKTNIVISGFIEAKYTDATPTTLKFTHETWEHVHHQMEGKFPGKKILGWIHTHPNFGIFLSDYDKFIHQNFFSDDSQVAYVVDPIQHLEGFYFWINGNLEKCKGFYIYEKTGKAISIAMDKDEPTKVAAPSSSVGRTVLLAVLTVLVAVLFIMNVSLSNRVDELETRLTSTATQLNQNQQFLYQQWLAGQTTTTTPSTGTATTTDGEGNGEDTTAAITTTTTTAATTTTITATAEGGEAQ